MPNQFLLDVFSRRSKRCPLLGLDLPQNEGAENSVVGGLVVTEADESAKLGTVSSSSAPGKQKNP